MRRIALLLPVLALLAACTKSEPATAPAVTPLAATTVAVKPAPTVPAAWADVADQLPETWVASLAFAETMVADHGATIDQVTCHCCKQSLGACFRGTIARAANSCPPL